MRFFYTTSKDSNSVRSKKTKVVRDCLYSIFNTHKLTYNYRPASVTTPSASSYRPTMLPEPPRPQPPHQGFGEGDGRGRGGWGRGAERRP